MKIKYDRNDYMLSLTHDIYVKLVGDRGVETTEAADVALKAACILCDAVEKSWRMDASGNLASP